MATNLHEVACVSLHSASVVGADEVQNSMDGVDLQLVRQADGGGPLPPEEVPQQTDRHQHQH